MFSLNVSASALGHLQAAHKYFDVCSLYVRMCVCVCVCVCVIVCNIGWNLRFQEKNGFAKTGRTNSTPYTNTVISCNATSPVNLLL